MAKTAFIFGAKTQGLNYTDNDLALISEALTQHDYQVIQPTGKKYEVIEKLEEVASSTNQADTFVLYFSGHGIIEKGKLFLGYNDNVKISVTTIFDALSNCYARSKLIILDTCSSGSAASDWEYKIDEDNYCLLTATRRLMPAKELDEYKASFLTYHIHQALTKQYPLDKENRITVRTLIDYLEESQKTYNSSKNPIQVEKPNLYGGNNLEIARINDPNLKQGSVRVYRGDVKNVCVISSEYPPNIVGGLGVHVYELTQELANLSINLDLILPYLRNRSGYKNLYKSNLKLHSLSDKAEASYSDPYSWLRFAFYAINEISSMNPKPDVIHCHDWVAVLAGIALRWKYNIPLVFHLHLPNKRPFCASIENLGLICADLITVNSNSIKDDIFQRFIKENINVKVIPNGVNINEFKPSYDWPESDNYILFVGRLVPQKGIEYLIRAFYYVVQKFPSVTLKIVGEGEQEDLLRQLCINYMIDEKVKFVGFKRGEDLVKLYQKAKLVVVPSIYEPFGMTVLEAMACKRPVIASDLMGLKDNIVHNKTGFLFESEDHLDLAQWIMTMLSNKNLMNDMGIEGKRYIDDNQLNWKEIAKKYLTLYENIPTSQMDFSITSKAIEFRDQIVRQTKENSKKSGSKDDYLDTLFSWIN